MGCAQCEQANFMVSSFGMWPFAGVTGKGKGANPTHPHRGTAKRLGHRYGRPRPFGALAFRLCLGR